MKTGLRYPICVLTISVLVIVAWTSASAMQKDDASQHPDVAKPPRKPFVLPGLVIDFERRCVDVDATICLDDGYLELIACTKGSKEHESVVAVTARPMHIHTALLTLGSDSGHPAMRKLVKEEQTTRWVHLPPRGDSIEVFLVTSKKGQTPSERPIGDFVVRSRDRIDEVDGAVISAPDQAGKEDQEKEFPHTFLFAGSHLRDRQDGPRQYLADLSGNVISVATFGDELLCLPFHQTQENAALMWRIKPGSLPDVGTKVTLRLRPQKNRHTGAIQK